MPKRKILQENKDGSGKKIKIKDEDENKSENENETENEPFPGIELQLAQAVYDLNLDKIKGILDQHGSTIQINKKVAYGSATRDKTVLSCALKNKSTYGNGLYSSTNEREVIVRLLLNAKADPNIPDEFGHFPLNWSAACEKSVVSRLLLEAKANVNAFYMYSTSIVTPLGDCVYNTCRLDAKSIPYRIESAKLLLEYHANAHLDQTTLDCAQPCFVELIQQHFASLAALILDVMTPLASKDVAGIICGYVV